MSELKLTTIKQLAEEIDQLQKLQIINNRDYHENNISETTHKKINYILNDSITSATFCLIEYIKNIKKGFTKAEKCGTLLWNAENRIFGIFSVYGDTGVFIARLHQPFAGVSAKIFYFER